MKHPDQTRNMNPTPEARFAMLHWHNEYAAQGGGSMDFYDKLTPRQKRYCEDAVQYILKAAEAHRREIAA